MTTMTIDDVVKLDSSLNDSVHRRVKRMWTWTPELRRC